MNQYITTAAITLPAGVRLELSKQQALAREHILHRAGKDNIYTTLAPVCFKAGESLGYAGDLPKALADLVEVDLVETPPARKAKTKTEKPVAELVS